MGLRGLADRAFIVTGAASGIGYATAGRLITEGCRVALVDLDEEKLRRAASVLDSTEAITITADVGVAEDVASYVQRAREHFGGIDGLFNNAGMTAPRVPLADLEPRWAQRLLQTNVMGVFHGMRELIRVALKDGNSPAIVNTASGLALAAAPNTAVYGATKAAIVSLTRSTAVENARHGIRVNAVLPGPTETPGLLSAPEELRHQFLEAVPLGRFGRVDEVADVAAWLLSDESTFVTGAAIAVDGGQSA